MPFCNRRIPKDQNARRWIYLSNHCSEMCAVHLWDMTWMDWTGCIYISVNGFFETKTVANCFQWFIWNQNATATQTKLNVISIKNLGTLRIARGASLGWFYDLWISFQCTFNDIFNILEGLVSVAESKPMWEIMERKKNYSSWRWGEGRLFTFKFRIVSLTYLSGLKFEFIRSFIRSFIR